MQLEVREDSSQKPYLTQDQTEQRGKPRCDQAKADPPSSQAGCRAGTEAPPQNFDKQQGSHMAGGKDGGSKDEAEGKVNSSGCIVLTKCPCHTN